jgi:hypothetical protein
MPPAKQNLSRLGLIGRDSYGQVLKRCVNSIYTNAELGTKETNYSDINWPGSSFASAGIAVEKASIMVGNYLSGGASFTRGNKDTPIYLHRGGPYQQEIHSAYNMKVVLYDTTDRRGWLIDGSSALLHITRTQLGSSPYSESDLFDIDKFKHANPTGGALAAKKVLLDSGNRALVIFEEVETSVESKAGIGEGAAAEIKTKTTRWTYQDLVRQTYHILEQIHDYETKIMTSQSSCLRFTDREKLTGFAFMDIVDVQNDLRPRMATLKPSGRGWVDLTRSIRAITLLGKGFGEIIKPSINSNPLCKTWKQVPTGKDYLVASTSTLKEICKRYGNQDSHLMELANGIYWHKPDKLFESCECKSMSCDRVQVLSPASLGPKRHPQPFDCDNGAVIFGRSRRFPLHWPSRGDPVEGGSSNEEHDDTSDFHDSGVGSALSQPASSTANLGSPSVTPAGSVGSEDAANIEPVYAAGVTSSSGQSILSFVKSVGQVGESEADQPTIEGACQELPIFSCNSTQILSEPAKGATTTAGLTSAKWAINKARKLYIFLGKKGARDGDAAL